MSLISELVKQDFGIQGRGRWLRSEIHSSLVVDEENNRFYFNARGISGGPSEYLCNIRGWSKSDAEKYLKTRQVFGVYKEEDLGLQIKYAKLVDAFYHEGKFYRDYWYSRCLTDSTIDLYRLGHFEDWFLIPIYKNGLFVNFQCRKEIPEKRIKFWYKDKDFSPVLYNSDVLKFVDTAYIVEGLVDCILLNQNGFPTVCTTNGANHWESSWINYFKTIARIYYIADNDKAGEFAAKKVTSMLGSSRVKIVRFEGFPNKFDSVDFFRSGKTVEEFKSFIQNTSRYIFE